MVALMLKHLDIHGGERVLEIGTCSGILPYLVGRSGPISRRPLAVHSDPGGSTDRVGQHMMPTAHALR
ncbi:MAG: hypothetical protein ACRDTG_19690 [Pseudonocardiaceae bacterium]